MKTMIKKTFAIMVSVSLIASLFSMLGYESAYGAEPIPHWTVAGTADATVTVVEDIYHGGNRSLHIRNRTPKTPNTYIYVYQKVPVKPNTKYNLSAWMKGNDAPDNWFGGGKGWSVRRGVPQLPEFDWVKRDSFSSYTTGADEHEFTFVMVSENTTANVWWDDVSMTELGSSMNLLQNAGFEEGLEPEPEPTSDDPRDLNGFLSSLGDQSYMPIFPSEDMVMNGDLNKWSGYQAISLPTDEAKQVRLPGWAGESDLSVKAKYAYDDSHFYMSFVVKDQAHRGVAGAAMWNGDSVQIGFSSDGTTYETEYGLALVNGAPDVWRWQSGAATLPKDAVTLAANRDETNKLTIYEVKLPWKAIFKEKPEDQFRFSILLNDNDSSVRRGYLQWTDGIGMGKDASKLGTAFLVTDNDAWLSWLDEVQEIRSGQSYTTSLDLLNTSDSDIVLRVSSAELELDREVTIPANKARRLVIEKSLPNLGEHTFQLVVEEAATGMMVNHETSFIVYETNEQLLARFDQIASQLPALDDKLEEAKQREIPTDYERINATVIRNFIQYGKDDVAHNLIQRATYVAEELEKLYSDAMSKLDGYLDGSLEAYMVPRYRTGDSRIGIDGHSFVADTYNSSTGVTERNPVIFTGYGHFDEVRRDIPKFEDYGTNIIQVETGPNRVIVPSEAWTVWSTNKSNGVLADITIDREMLRSGKGSLAIENKSPKANNVFATVSQQVVVTPNTTYRIKAWVKGEDVKNVWFPGGLNWSKRVLVPEGTYDWTEVTVDYTTAASETTMPFVILSENTGKVWFDDLSMMAVGSEVNLLKFAGFDDDAPHADKGYVLSKTKIQEDIQQVLERSSQHNIAVNLLLSPHYFPNWTKEIWPELNSNATEFIQFNFESPKAKEMIRDYLETIVPLVKDYTSLHSITLTNEPVYASNEDAVYHLPKFHLYLQEVYTNGIAELNQTYGTDYGSFAEVPMPLHYSSTPAYYDWFVFNNQLFTGWHKWMADIIHELAPDIPVHAKVMNGILGGDTWGINYEMLAELSQINGNDASNYLSNGKSGHLRENMFYDFQTSLKQAPVFNSEHHIIPDGDHNYIPEQAEHVNTQLWQGAIHGRSASTVWVWGRTYDTSSVIDGSVMHRPDVAATVGKVNLDMNRLIREVSAFQDDQAQVAILYSLPAVLYEVRDAYPSSVKSLNEAVSLSGVKVGFITEKQIREGKASQYKAIIVPQQRYLESGTLELLDDYAKSSGSLVIIGNDSLQLDERSQPLDASIRSLVLDHATVLDASWTAEQLKEWFMDAPLYKEINSVVLIDEATQKPVNDVEWRSVKHNGKLLVNMANYGVDGRTVSVYLNGEKLANGVNLLDKSHMGGSTIELPQRMPMLMQWNLVDLDHVSPVTSVEIDGLKGNGEWYTSDAVVKLNPFDENTGVARTEYRLTDIQQLNETDNADDYIEYASPIRISEGIYDLSFRSSDFAGNVENEQTIRLMIDKTAPHVILLGNGSPLSDIIEEEDDLTMAFELEASDNLSGITGQVITVNGNPYLPGSVLEFAGDLGDHTITAAVYDEAGNQSMFNVTIRITTSIDSMRALIDRYVASGELKGPLQAKLDNKLDQAEHHYNQGRIEQALKHMQDFLKLLEQDTRSTDISDHVKGILLLDGESLIPMWSGN